ncbi:MAG: class I SAM-dependent methyltransferase [Betaproteobacteria bacterium]|nr:class I SAM-dependent methyltransferase [Betaproteobacteria bacterium]MDE2123733.1 class I SAM-dependent methyltransferase [Betaproteobacteria bacterium]MDE2185195.1 class I SAM-dependent methyltransferase [Betaproteobacteria bacterium]MDE2324755.1 class I SAM-dependent methyltransferase [Betaproteobacteria bacterium]
MDQHQLAAAQFGTTAQAYLTSAVHAQGADLQRLRELGRTLPGAHALDLGCGAGHAGFALAEAGMQVTACDLSAAMLDVVVQEARRRGLSSLKTRLGPAEQLPFDAAAFDLVVTRFSAHHWLDVPAALREARRVLRPNGMLVVVDAVAPESPLLDTLLQTVELLRDASHVRDYRVSEWDAMLRAAGFDLPEVACWTLPMVFDTWVARMRTPALRVHALRDVWAQAAAEAKAHFQLQADGSFLLDVAWLQCRPLG